MTSGRFHLNGESDGSEQNSATTSASATNTTGVGSVGNSSSSSTTDKRENENIRTFVFTSRGSSSPLQRTDRTHSSAAIEHSEELEIKIPEVILSLFIFKNMFEI